MHFLLVLFDLVLELVLSNFHNLLVVLFFDLEQLLVNKLAKVVSLSFGHRVAYRPFVRVLSPHCEFVLVLLLMLSQLL